MLAQFKDQKHLVIYIFKQLLIYLQEFKYANESVVNSMVTVLNELLHFLIEGKHDPNERAVIRNKGKDYATPPRREFNTQCCNPSRRKRRLK